MVVVTFVQGKKKMWNFLLRPYKINYLFIIPARVKFTCCANNCLFIIPVHAYWPSRRWTLGARQSHGHVHMPQLQFKWQLPHGLHNTTNPLCCQGSKVGSVTLLLLLKLQESCLVPLVYVISFIWTISNIQTPELSAVTRGVWIIEGPL